MPSLQSLWARALILDQARELLRRHRALERARKRTSSATSIRWARPTSRIYAVGTPSISSTASAARRWGTATSPGSIRCKDSRL